MKWITQPITSDGVDFDSTPRYNLVIYSCHVTCNEREKKCADKIHHDNQILEKNNRSLGYPDLLL